MPDHASFQHIIGSSGVIETCGAVLFDNITPGGKRRHRSAYDRLQVRLGGWLRVVAASIRSKVVQDNTDTAVIMIVEKAANMIAAGLAAVAQRTRCR